MTKVIKINYPSKTAEEIGAITAAIRERILDHIESAQLSYSFSSNKESGYIMIYPTAPVLSIRVSTHETDGTEVGEKLITHDGRKVTINAEVEGGQAISEALVMDALMKMKEKGQDIKYLLSQHKLI